MKTIADLLLARCTGIPKNFAKANGLPYEEFRHVLRDGHVPSDKTLLLYAERLGLDPALLILTAYWQRAPECARGLLEPVTRLVQDGILKGE